MVMTFLSLNRTLRWCKDVSVFAANLRHGREVVDELGLSKSKPVSSPASGDGVARCQDDESKPLDEDEERLYQRIIVKLNYQTHDQLDLKYATSCLASAASSPHIGDMRVAKRVGRHLRKAPLAWQGFPFYDSRPDVCTKALPGNRIRELCRLPRVYVCCSEGDMGDDPDEWRLSRLDELCRGEKFEQSCDAESEVAC